MGLSTDSSAKPEDNSFKGIADRILNIRRDSPLDITQSEKQLELARKTADPLTLPDYRTRMASIESKLVAISKDPDYAKLSDDGKVLLRNMIYDKFVVPTRRDAKLDPIDRGEFLRRTIDVSHLDPSEQFYQTINLGQATVKTSSDWVRNGVRIGESFFSGAGDLIDAGMKYAHNQWMGMHTGAYNYAYPSGDYKGNNYSHSWDEGFNKYVEKAYDWAENKLERGNDIDNYWLDTHPANSYTSRFLGMGGYLAGQLPFYEGLGGAVKAGAGAAAELAGPLGTNLTEALTKTPQGKLVAKALQGAVQGYMMGTIKQEDEAGRRREAAQWGLQEMAFGALGMGINSAFLAGRQFLGKVIAYGGKQLAQSMFDGAMADAFDQHLEIDIRPEANFQVPRVGIDKQFIWTPLREKDIADIEIGGPHSHMLGDVAVSPHSSFPQAGHLIYDGKIYPYGNLKEMQSQYNFLAKLAEVKRAKLDPVLHETNGAAEHILRELTQELFGHKNIKGLNQEELGQLHSVYSYMLSKTADEVPIHASEVVEQEQAKAIQQHNKTNPTAAKWDAKLRKDGVIPEKAVTKNIVENAKKRSGVKSPDKAIEQINAVKKGIKATRQVKPKPEYEPPEGAEADFSLEEALGPETMKALKQGRLDNLHTIDTAKDQGKAYFRKKEPRLASDGTVVGARDKRTWRERLSDEKTDEFVETLKMADGDGIDFEHGPHRILFHWGNRKVGAGEPYSSKALTDKMAKELRKEYDTPERKLTFADFDRASDLLGRHLIQLAKSNNLQADGRMKVFKSSNFFDQPTIWQAELDSDVERMEYDLLGHMLQHFPDVLEGMHAVMEGFQNKRSATYSVDDWLRYNRMIDSLMAGEITPAMKKEMASMGY